ncbi:hypothetical protein OnM2_024013 [Erysiphe neolycopersici]|uniref:Glycine zipper 2TM domain-containing protein n=1 Tax=Erysiphe neolycopersici TaxID=212602 RepID=A0A420I1K6_9PEZI|nr:hypothetical protein OnM2_024013 [Erysiphe neolycopersici]
MSNSDYYNSGGAGGGGDDSRHLSQQQQQQQQQYHQGFNQPPHFNHPQQNYGQPPGLSSQSGYNNPSQGHIPQQGYNPSQQSHNNYQAQSPQYANYPPQHQGYGPQSPPPLNSGHNHSPGYGQQHYGGQHSAPPPASNYNHGPGHSSPINNELYQQKSPSSINPYSNNGGQNVPPYQLHQNYHTDQDGPRNDNIYGPGQEGDRGVGATLIGGATGGFLAHKTGAGKVATVLGTVAGVVGANIIEHKLGHKDEKKHKDEKINKDEKKYKKDKKHKKEKKHKRHVSKSRAADSDSSGSDSD